ncbi:hypothetical protein CERSUDRAFT_153646 [Gelatoporia subvermispora B]|uniref:Telomere length regulation protein conserved domain-containing protein n=1 Tax=Ceriporiopsis subvermispora (strain B) TaxID=914234 RepID=M2R290_CERS8|nr:hypothetical protein CERSUDRAFT_153646 [Gelatoporia subvermispora B]
MSAEFLDAALAQIQDVIARLQSPITDISTLFQLLSAPLACIGLLPPRYRKHDVLSLHSKSFDIDRHVPPLQRALLEHIIPTWGSILDQEHAFELVEQYFCPDSMSFASPAAGRVAVHAYSTLLSIPLRQQSIRLLATLCKSYPIDVLHSVVFARHNSTSSGKQTITWEDCVRNVAAIPAKVANVVADSTAIPVELEQGAYFRHFSVRCEHLMWQLSSKLSRENISSIAYLLTKLVNIGAFPSTRTVSPSQPSFFSATLPTIKERLISPEVDRYSSFWTEVLSGLASTLALQSILASLFSALADVSLALDPSTGTRALVKREALLLRGILGRLRKDRGELVDSFTAIALGRDWSEGHARIFSCWAAGAEDGQSDTEALEILATRVSDMWTTPDHVRHSLLSRHRYMTTLFLTALSNFPPAPAPSPSPYLTLAFSPSFISSISTYISHLDVAVRTCGMLVGEVVAGGAGKKLDFGDWEGDEPEKQWARKLRSLIKARDADADLSVLENDTNPTLANNEQISAEIPNIHGTPTHPIKPSVEDVGYDSDDSLTGYAFPSSSRSPSPTPSELDEIEKDPTLRVGKKKVPRPVYLAQLGEMIRSTSGLESDKEDVRAEQVEVALDIAEELIRRKSAYGTELEENAVNLAYGLIGLRDNYETEGFDEKRQAAVTALVACCPRKAAPALIEEFFKNQYSASQRYVILNALVLGARELASLPFPQDSQVKLSVDRISFPSKRLPPALHKKYLSAEDELSSNNPAQLLLEGISGLAIEKGKEATADKVPQYVRERQLRIRPTAKVSELPRGSAAMSQLPGLHAAPPKTTFVEVAAEFFICPMINRFWLFLRDEQVREARTSNQPALYRYRGAGTGLILNAMVLSRFIAALAVLMHTARNAKEWLAILAPDALELAVTLGTRPVSKAEGEDEDADEPAKDKEAAVLTTALELALVVLDGSLDLDGGRTLGLEHTALLYATGEWAKEVFERLEQGVRVLGGGGVQEVALKRAAAGVLLKVDELSSKWRRSMIDMGSI